MSPGYLLLLPRPVPPALAPILVFIDRILSHNNMPKSKRSISQRGVGLRKEHNQNKNVVYIGGCNGQESGDDQDRHKQSGGRVILKGQVSLLGSSRYRESFQSKKLGVRRDQS